MMPVCRAATARAVDAHLIDVLGLPGRALMELAGAGADAALAARWPDSPVTVLCGPGNNGGDGAVLARWAAGRGVPVRVGWARPPETPDARANAALLRAVGVWEGSVEDALAGHGVVVDALLGTGQVAAPRGPVAAAVGAAREARAAGRPVVALDLPTGLCADTGQPLGGPLQVVEADLTLAFGTWKPAHLLPPGRFLCGEAALVSIGAAAAWGSGGPRPDGHRIDAADVAAWVPRVAPAAAKWDRGHVAVRAEGGAGVLAARGAFAAGAGLVTLLADPARWSALHGLPPEVILAPPEALDASRHDVLVLGPGLGRRPADAAEALRAWAGFPGPLVADADALSALADAGSPPPAGGVRVLTPHVAEAARLLGVGRAAVEADRLGAVDALAAWGVPLLKGPGSIVGGGPPWFVTAGGPALATAGTGDVLAGMAGALLAAGLAPREALAAAAFLHGQAGERMPAGGTASDLLHALRAR
jgi:NAD(P)H-hydrate epimerase